jgi:MFS family permease
LPRDVRREAGRFDAGGAAALTAFLAAAAWAVNGIDTSALPQSLFDARVWPFLALASIAAVVFWRVEKRASDPVLHPALFASRQLRVIGAVAFVAGVTEAGMVFLPAMAVSALAVDAATASCMMLPLVLTLIVGAPVAGQLLDRVGPRPVIQAGLTLSAAGLVVFGTAPMGFASFYAAGMLVGLGLSSLLGAPLRYVVLQEAGEARRGAGQGLLTLFLSAGQLVGAAAIGGIAASAASAATGYPAALLSAGVACAATLPLTALLAGRRRGRSGVPLPDEPRTGS